MTTQTLFPDPVLENEAIELLALESLHRQASPTLRARLGLGWHAQGGAQLSIAAGLPASAFVVNRAFGLRPESLGPVAATYRAAGVERFFVHPASDEPDLMDAAQAAGLVPARGWQKFTRLRGAPLPEAAGLSIRRVLPGADDDAAAVGRIVSAAFDLGTAAAPWLACLCHDPRWHVFLAEIDGRPAGTGSLFVADGLGWIDWDATDPALRGCGVQRALMLHRLRLADAMDLQRTHTCTGLPVPGDPQHSWNNIRRCGFDETSARANFAPPRQAS